MLTLRTNRLPRYIGVSVLKSNGYLHDNRLQSNRLYTRLPGVQIMMAVFTAAIFKSINGDVSTVIVGCMSLWQSLNALDNKSF